MFKDQSEFCQHATQRFYHRSNSTAPKAILCGMVGVAIGSFILGTPTAVIGGAIGLAAPVIAFEKDNKRNNFNTKHGAAAVSLRGQDLLEYANWMGKPETAAQLLLAEQNHIPLTGDQKAFLKKSFPNNINELVKQDPKPGQTFWQLQSKVQDEEGNLVFEQPTKLWPDSYSEAVATEEEEDGEDEWEEVDIPVEDLAAQMAAKLKPTIISAMPRTGKGILLSQASRLAKKANPDLKIWMIDLKANPAESGYWSHCDHVLSFKLKALPPGDEGAIAKIEKFIADWQSDPAAQKLLIFDEQILVEARLPKWYKSYVISLVKSEGSSGESDGTILWVVMQSPLIGDIGLSGGNRSVYSLIALARLATEEGQNPRGWMESAKASKFIPADLPDDADFEKSPRGTLAYSSALNRWVAIPEYPVPKPVKVSAKVDSKTHLQGDISPTVIQPKVSAPTVIQLPEAQPTVIQETAIAAPTVIQTEPETKPFGFQVSSAKVEERKELPLVPVSPNGEVHGADSPFKPVSLPSVPTPETVVKDTPVIAAKKYLESKIKGLSDTLKIRAEMLEPEFQKLVKEGRDDLLDIAGLAVWKGEIKSTQVSQIHKRKDWFKAIEKSESDTHEAIRDLFSDLSDRGIGDCFGDDSKMSYLIPGLREE